MLDYQRLAKIRAIANSARLVKRKSFFSYWHAICLPSTFHASPSQCVKINLRRIAFFPCAASLFGYNKGMKIKNEKHFATLGKDYTAKDAMCGPITYKKGETFPTHGMYETNGHHVVEGHGIGHIIPRELFTKFTCTWDEVEKETVNGVTTTKVTHKEEDETKKILDWWAERDAKKNDAKTRHERAVLRARIANLRKNIKAVKTGEAEKELEIYLDMLAKLC